MPGKETDCAVLIVAAVTGVFEAGISKNGLTRWHTLFAISLGGNQLIVGVNKMDSFHRSSRTSAITLPPSSTTSPAGTESSSNITGFKEWKVERKEVIANGKNLIDALIAILSAACLTDMATIQSSNIIYSHMQQQHQSCARRPIR